MFLGRERAVGILEFPERKVIATPQSAVYTMGRRVARDLHDGFSITIDTHTASPDCPASMKITQIMAVLPPWIPRSTFGAILALVYVVLAVFVVAGDRGQTSGGWITLNGIGSFLITFPVSLAGEKLNMRPDFRRNIDMGFAIAVCAVMIYLLGAGLGRLARALLSGGGPG